MRKLLLTTTALLAFAAMPAKADTFVTLGGVQWNTTNSGNVTLSATVPGGNQPRNIPCLICGENQPQQPAGFGFNDFGNSGSLTNIQAFSNGDTKVSLADNVIGTGYTIGSGSPFLAFLLANGDTANNLSFNVGVDINDNGNAQTLNSFFLLDLTQHTVLASFTGGTTGNVPNINNGTGFPDYTLSGFTLNGVNPLDQIIFVARMTGMNDGPDSFFLTPGVQAAVPELSTWGMMLLGFSGVGLMAMRKRRNESKFRLA